LREPRDVIIRPIITEKGTFVKSQSKYIFEVSMPANKHEVKKAIENLFKVHVLKVNIIRMKGKVKSIGRFTGKKKDWKKAMVTLREGETIELFEGL